MTEPNNQSPTDTQNEKIIESLRYEIADLKSRLTKKDDVSELKKSHFSMWFQAEEGRSRRDFTEIF